MTSLAFSPDGRLLASGSGNETHLWRVEDGTLLRTIEEKTRLSPDGRLLISGADRTIRIWGIAETRW